MFLVSNQMVFYRIHGSKGGGGGCHIRRFFWRFLMMHHRKKTLMCLSFLLYIVWKFSFIFPFSNSFQRKIVKHLCKRLFSEGWILWAKLDTRQKNFMFAATWPSQVNSTSPKLFFATICKKVWKTYLSSFKKSLWIHWIYQ